MGEYKIYDTMILEECHILDGLIVEETGEFLVGFDEIFNGILIIFYGRW